MANRNTRRKNKLAQKARATITWNKKLTKDAELYKNTLRKPVQDV